MNQHRETLNDCDKFYFILFICNAQFLKYKMMFWIQMKKSKKKNSEYRIKARKSNDIRTQRIWMNFDRNKNKINKFRTMSSNTHTHTPTDKQTKKQFFLDFFPSEIRISVFVFLNGSYCSCFNFFLVFFFRCFFSLCSWMLSDVIAILKCYDDDDMRNWVNGK